MISTLGVDVVIGIGTAVGVGVGVTVGVGVGGGVGVGVGVTVGVGVGVTVGVTVGVCVGVTEGVGARTGTAQAAKRTAIPITRKVANRNMNPPDSHSNPPAYILRLTWLFLSLELTH